MKKNERMSSIGYFIFAVLFLVISITTVITVTKTIARNNLRNDNRLVTITAFTEEEPHRETLAIWDYTSNGKNYTNIEYIEYSGTYVVEVETYNGDKLGTYEIEPQYYGEDKIYEGAEIERYKLQPIKTSIETIERPSSKQEEVLVSIEPIKKEERMQTLVPIKDIKK